MPLQDQTPGRASLEFYSFLLLRLTLAPVHWPCAAKDTLRPTRNHVRRKGKACKGHLVQSRERSYVKYTCRKVASQPTPQKLPKTVRSSPAHIRSQPHPLLLICQLNDCCAECYRLAWAAACCTQAGHSSNGSPTLEKHHRLLVEVGHSGESLTVCRCNPCQLCILNNFLSGTIYAQLHVRPAGVCIRWRSAGPQQ